MSPTVTNQYLNILKQPQITRTLPSRRRGASGRWTVCRLLVRRKAHLIFMLMETKNLGKTALRLSDITDPLFIFKEVTVIKSLLIFLLCLAFFLSCCCGLEG
jgi:hypothetical protein